MIEMINRFRAWAWPATALLMITLFVIACSKEDEREPCLQPQNVALRFQARRMADTLALDTTLPNALITPIGGQGSVIFGEARAFTLFLSPQSDTCRFAIQADSAVSPVDTITLRYRRRLQFISNACGYSYWFSLDSVYSTLNVIDSIRITNNLVSNEASVNHMLVYFRR